MASTHPANIVEKPLNTRKTLNIIAPITIVRTKQLIWTESFRAATSLGMVSRRLAKPRTKAPKAPAAPASEGVKIPVNKPPITTRKRINTPQMPFNEANIALSGKD